jgi:hypothetical protein
MPLDIMLLDALKFPRLHECSGLLKDGLKTGVVELSTL